MTPADNVEYFKQEVVVSCTNVFNVAHEALRNKSDLVKVIVMEHASCFDEHLKPALAKFANTTFNNLWMASPFKSKITIAAHNLQCDEETRVSRYTGDRNIKYDGIHMYGQAGKTAFTRSLLNILTESVEVPLTRHK